jgi:hypothetical protein
MLPSCPNVPEERVSMKATCVVLLVLVLGMTAAACNNSNSSLTAPTNPPEVSDPPVTGSVAVGGSAFTNFVVSQAGDVQITLSQAGPPPTITVGLGVGTPSALTCPLTVGSTKTAASPTPLDIGTLSAGTYCVEVFDAGNQSGPITYTLTVTHP